MVDRVLNLDMKHRPRSVLVGCRRVTVVTGALLLSSLATGSWAKDSTEKARRGGPGVPPPRPA